MSRLSLLATITVATGLAAASAVYAQQPSSSNATGSGTPAAQAGTVPAPQSAANNKPPRGGRGFGEHVSTMASVLGHPQDHGVMFGDCVSDMAQAGGMGHGMCDHP